MITLSHNTNGPELHALTSLSLAFTQLAAENKALKTENDKLRYRVNILVRSVDSLSARVKAAEAAASPATTSN